MLVSPLCFGWNFHIKAVSSFASTQSKFLLVLWLHTVSQIDNSSGSGQVVRMPLKVDAIGYARRSARVVELMEVLKG